jgi:hypothetical protein
MAARDRPFATAGGGKVDNLWISGEYPGPIYFRRRSSSNISTMILLRARWVVDGHPRGKNAKSHDCYAIAT